MEEENNVEVRDLRNGDWYWIHKVVYNDYGIKIGAIGISVYNALCFYANRNGECFPSISTMAKKLDISEPTVYKYLKLLEKNRLIRKENRQKENKSNIYYLLKLFNKPYKPALEGHIKSFNTNKNYINNNNITSLGSKEPPKRNGISFKKELYNKVLKEYQSIKNIALCGNEFKPVQQSIKTMFMSGRTPEQIISCMKFMASDDFYKYHWTIDTVKKKLPEFLSKQLGDPEPEKIYKIGGRTVNEKEYKNYKGGVK